MSPNEIATTGFILNQVQVMLTEIKKIQEQVQPSEQAGDIYYTIEEVAKATRFTRATIEKWIKAGKKAPGGRKVKLPYYEFANGTFRIKREDLIAFGKVGQIEVPAHMKVAV